MVGGLRARSWPAEEEWAFGWVARIGQLYKDNEDRLLVLDGKPAEFAQINHGIEQSLDKFSQPAEHGR